MELEGVSVVPHDRLPLHSTHNIFWHRHRQSVPCDLRQGVWLYIRIWGYRTVFLFVFVAVFMTSSNFREDEVCEQARRH